MMIAPEDACTAVAPSAPSLASHHRLLITHTDFRLISQITVWVLRST